MKVKLYAETDNKLSARSQILLNRGLPPESLDSYINSTFEDNVYPPELLGIDKLECGRQMLIRHIEREDDIFVVVDSDADGFTASATFINYINKAYPNAHIVYYIHDGKEHGLNDCIDKALNFNMVVLPDASSNDYDCHKLLKENGADVLVLDHHEAEKESEYACVINNQLCNYPNKALSGVGVVWQFCRYLDKCNNTDYANQFLDLVATGLMADMMSLLSIETKTLIFEGYKEKNIKNPFIYKMILKNNFSLNKSDYAPSKRNGLFITPMGAAFFISPFINAIVRSGEPDEKEIIFKSMLYEEAFEEIPSTKRGHKFGEVEQVVDQALRVCTNVKNRQTKSIDAGTARLNQLIQSQSLLENNVLLFLLEKGEVNKNIAGLMATKLVNQYQRPVCILTKTDDFKYAGSARSYGDIDFKEMCRAAGADYAEGHAGAFGLCVDVNNISSFLQYLNSALEGLISEPAYKVDYIWEYNNIDAEKVLEIADLNDYWGKDLERSLVYIKNIPVNENTFKVMRSNTLKYELPQASIVQFGGTDEEIEKFSSGRRTINTVCKCNKNEWNGQISPQFILVDYEVVEEEKMGIFDWGF